VFIQNTLLFCEELEDVVMMAETSLLQELISASDTPIIMSISRNKLYALVTTH
jgi:hypothetical protein